MVCEDNSPKDSSLETLDQEGAGSTRIYNSKLLP